MKKTQISIHIPHFLKMTYSDRHGFMIGLILKKYIHNIMIMRKPEYESKKLFEILALEHFKQV